MSWKEKRQKEKKEHQTVGRKWKEENGQVRMWKCSRGDWRGTLGWEEKEDEASPNDKEGKRQGCRNWMWRRRLRKKDKNKTKGDRKRREQRKVGRSERSLLMPRERKWYDWEITSRSQDWDRDMKDSHMATSVFPLLPEGPTRGREGMKVRKVQNESRRRQKRHLVASPPQFITLRDIWSQEALIIYTFLSTHQPASTVVSI